MLAHGFDGANQQRAEEFAQSRTVEELARVVLEARNLTKFVRGNSKHDVTKQVKTRGLFQNG